MTPIKQREPNGARCAHCGCVLARDHDDPLCPPCQWAVDMLAPDVEPLDLPAHITGDDVRRIAKECFGSLHSMARAMGVYYGTLYGYACGKDTVGPITRQRIERAIIAQRGEVT